MKTRFDIHGKWITGSGEVVRVSDMDTDHILNTMRMLIQKPARSMSMLIHDVENHTYMDKPFAPWKADGDGVDVIKLSIHNITSMSMEQIQIYVSRSPLFLSMCEELDGRGVNVDNIISILPTCDAF